MENEACSRETAAETENSSQHSVLAAKPKRSEFFVSEHGGKLRRLQILCHRLFLTSFNPELRNDHQITYNGLFDSLRPKEKIR